MLQDENESHAWMFQYNPRFFDLEETIRKRLVEDWTAFWERSYIREGQRVFILRSGKFAGIVATGHIATPLYERPSQDRFGRYWVDLMFDALVVPILSRQEMLLDPLLRDYRPYVKGVFRANVLLPPEVAFRTAHLVHSRLQPITQYAGPTQDLEQLTLDEQQQLDANAFNPGNILDARQRTVAAIVRRQGQSTFREALLQSYQGRCAITGCDVVAVLEAAHIAPYLGPETNNPANGLLLRADIHTLFDLGLIAIDSATMTVLIAPSLANSSYQELAGAHLRIPSDRAYQPSRLALDKHRAWAALPTSIEATD